MTDTLTEHALATADMVPHIATLYRLAYRADNLVEFGVRTGVSTWVLLDALASDGVLHSHDIDAATFEQCPLRVRQDSRWRFHAGDSLDAERPPVPPDLVFIDTTHEYHQTIAELELVGSWETRCIVLHDWALPDVRDAAEGFLRRHRAYVLEGIEPSQWGLAWLRRS